MPDNSPPARPTYLPPPSPPPPPKVQPTYLPPEVMAVKDVISSYGPPPSGSKMVFVTPPSDETETGPDPINDFPPNNINPDPFYEPDLIIDLPKPFEVTKDEPLIESQTEYSPPKDLLNFPPNVNSKYYPPGMVVAKNQINSYIPPPSGNKDEAPDAPAPDAPHPKYEAPKDLYNFPPNVDTSYLPPEMRNPDNPISSYLPPPSGNKDEAPAPDAPHPKYKAPKDLYNFPPNVDTSYLPPEMRNPDNPISSYLPPPSGNKDEAFFPPKKYSPPKDLHNFPPNIDSQYLPPEMRNPQNPVSSYLPPPSGDQNSQPAYNPGPLKYIPPKTLFSFPPNVDATYLPPEMRNPLSVTSYLPPPSGSVEDNQSSMPNFVGQQPYQYGPPPSGPPASMMVEAGGEHDHSHEHDHHHDHHDHHHEHYGPPPPDMPPSEPPADEHDHHHHHHHEEPPADEHDHHHHHHHDEPPADSGPPSMPPSGPPDMMPTGPPADEHDHHHHHYDESPPTGYSGLYGHDSSPELIYDYDPHHHDFHHDEPIAITTAAPEPEEPRVKKYSYYYLGRKLWYIPLYFTLWFCLYVAALIFRSIGRHKVH